VDAAALLAPFPAASDRAALLLDVDGTLAPIVPRPELARVPEDARAELRRLAERYLLVACVSGRPGEQAAELVGVAGIRYVGNHGLELDPRAVELAGVIGRFRAEVDGAWPVEDKGLSLSFHFREAPDEAAAVAALEPLARRAAASGLEARWGRKVLEIRPRDGLDKGGAVRLLLDGCGAELGLYAGDDATDLDAFASLAEANLRHAVRIAVASAEAPPALLDGADLVVADPAELIRILRLL
jgi:trehalose 6-phosphate phosphatase